MYTAQDIILTASREVGYHEKKTNAKLDTDINNGSNNWNKYADYFDKKCPNWYGKKVNGYEWCAIFVDCMAVQTFGTQKAAQIFCRPTAGNASQSCTNALKYFKAANRFSKDPIVGAQVFFVGSEAGKSGHTGIVKSFTASKVVVIEGNSSNTVAEKTYTRSNAKILGYGLPWYESEEDNKWPERVLKGVARAVIAGDYGNGVTRKANLQADGVPVEAVNKLVNEIIKGGN